MKVLLFNGSPNENGCTDAALRHMSKVLTERNIQTEIFQIGRRVKGGCMKLSISFREPMVTYLRRRCILLHLREI